MATTQLDAADALLQDAHARAYRFPAGFAGFGARLTWVDNQGSGTADVEIRPDADPAVAIDGECPDWVASELRSIVAHRRARAYEDGDGALGKRVGETNALGTTVELEDELDSSYVVEDGRIALVTRSLHGSRFTIVVQERAEIADGTAVPTAFTVVYRDEEGRLDATEAYTDTTATVGTVVVPASRKVVRADADGVTSRLLRLEGHTGLAGGKA